MLKVYRIGEKHEQRRMMPGQLLHTGSGRTKLQQETDMTVSNEITSVSR